MKKKHGHHFDLPRKKFAVLKWHTQLGNARVNVSKQLLAPGGLSAECVHVSVM